VKNIGFEKPNIELINGGQENNTATFRISPLSRGFGDTIGNSLRRVLLASLPGTAIYAIKIAGAQHEFTTLDGVANDVMHIILNLKKVIFKTTELNDTFKTELELNVVGPKVVTAGDINVVFGLEVVNPEQIITTVEEGHSFNMILKVKTGSGYINSATNKTLLEGEVGGVIAIDSIYTPVVRVNYTVEKTRGNDDILDITVETNGSITPSDAISGASKMITDILRSINESIVSALANIEYIHEEEVIEAVSKLDIPIEKLDISTRLFNALKRAGMSTVRDIQDLTEEKIMSFKSLGRKSFKELKLRLAEHGYELSSSFLDDESFDEETDE